MPFTYPLAEKLSKVFPGDVIFWKNATPDQLRLVLDNTNIPTDRLDAGPTSCSRARRLDGPAGE